jgi:hypothetical protein
VRTESMAGQPSEQNQSLRALRDRKDAEGLMDCIVG